MFTTSLSPLSALLGGYFLPSLDFSFVDPDPHSFWSAGSGSRRAKMTHKSEENSSFEVLDVLF
jgi:hypothetical protein